MKTETPEDVHRWFLRELQRLWPVAAGSLSLRRSPCIRERCPLCARGKGHASYALYGQRGGRRFSLYVPEELVPSVQRALEQGRRLRELMMEAGWRYAVALKGRRGVRASSGRRKG